MAKNTALNVQASSVHSALIYLAAVAVLVLFAIYPNIQAINGIKQRIQGLEIETMKQELLRPVYDALNERGKQHPARPLAFPKHGELGRDRVGKLTPVFTDMAARNGFKLLSLVPDVNSLSTDEGFFSIQLRLQGGFFPLRDFLLELGKMPYLVHIEEIELLAVKAERVITLKVWMAFGGLPSPGDPSAELGTDAVPAGEAT